jgi:glycine/D-amino acid oxidase-like deaminating enzyme/nitrite reductase/ring-hydroxylating ferredoxin subunit
MQAHYGKTRSLWMRHQDVPRFQPLEENAHSDVCVVGAGLAGLTTAYLLAREGLSVIVLEAGVLVAGESSRTTAHLSFALDDRYYELENLFGQDGARLAYESHARAVDMIQEIVERERINCEFTRLDGFLFDPPAGKNGELEREYKAALRAGLAVEQLDRAPLTHFNTGPCLRFPDQAQFDPLLYLSGLTRKITSMGGKIYTHTRVEKVMGGDTPEVETRRGNRVRARAIVLATNTPISDNLTIHARQAPYRTYAIAASIPWDAIPRALYWDTLDPYHYVRLRSASTPASNGGKGGKEANDTLIVGGEDHRQGFAGNERTHFEWLENWTRDHFPVNEIEYYWSGMVCEPADSLAFIGRDNSGQNVFIATGDSGHGMTHGTIAGILLTDLIRDRPNAWAKLYDPCRVTPAATFDYISDNAEVLSSLAEWVTPGEVSSEDDVAPGCGAIVRKGFEKRAVYRDRYGSFVELSAVCPHLGCIVSWNQAEESWDCPCHGSRFDPRGKLLRGPSTADLEEIA